MKIVIYTFEFLPFMGGIATYCHELARGLHSSGHEVSVVALRTAPLNEDAIPYRVDWVKQSSTRLRSMYNGIARLRRTIRETGPDVVLVTNQYALISVALFGYMVRTDCVAIIHGSEVLKHSRGRLARRILAWQMRRFYRSLVAIICVSEYTRRLFLSAFDVPMTRVFVVPNGMKDSYRACVDRGTEIRKRWNISSRTQVLLTLARLVPRKGQDVVIRALRTILDRRPDVVYLCAGVGPYQSELERLAFDYGVSHRVIFAGEVAEQEKYAYYDACDLFVMISRQEGDTVEGFGLSFLEAWHASRPVLGGRHGGVVEVIEDGVDGALVEPEDEDAVSRRILSLIGASAEPKAMGLRGREKARTVFSDVNMADLVVGCLRSTTGQID